MVTNLEKLMLQALGERFESASAVRQLDPGPPACCTAVVDAMIYVCIIHDPV